MNAWLSWLRVTLSPDHNTVYTSNGEDKKPIGFQEREWSTRRVDIARRRVCISQPPCCCRNNPRTIIPPLHHIHIYLHDFVRDVFERPRFTDNPWCTFGNTLAWLHVSRRGTAIWVDWNATYFFFSLFYRFSNAPISSLYARSIRIIVAIVVREISPF